MADEQDILLREIDEELKQENLQQLWKKYGTLIVGGALLLVAGVAGFQGWKINDLNTRIELGERFAVAQSLAQCEVVQVVVPDIMSTLRRANRLRNVPTVELQLNSLLWLDS